MKIKCKLYHDNFQNFKRYNIPKAQLIMEEYFCSWSGGVDSTATAILALEHKEPLTALVYCEVMFDKEVSGEVPEHAEFVHGTAIPWFQRHGAPVVHLKSEKTFMDIFWHQIKKGKRAGKYQGFPSPGFAKFRTDARRRRSTSSGGPIKGRPNTSAMQRTRTRGCCAWAGIKYLYFKSTG